MSVFMTNNVPSGVKKRQKCAKPESRQSAKMFFFLSSSSSLSSFLLLLLLLLQTGLFKTV